MPIIREKDQLPYLKTIIKLWNSSFRINETRNNRHYFSFHLHSYFWKNNLTPNTNSTAPVIPSIVRFTRSFLKKVLN